MDIMVELKAMVQSFSDGKFGGYYSAREVVDTLTEAKQEIERLRSTQFRWIPVGEQQIPKEKVMVLDGSGKLFMWGPTCVDAFSTITHWAPIPPLPEKSQEEKDEEQFTLWYKHTNDTGFKAAFLAGLAAARSQQP